MTMAHDEYVDSLCKEDDDLSVDDLLLAVAHIGAKPMRSKTEHKTTQGYQPVEYIKMPATVYCTTCQIQYDGIMTIVKGMDNAYDNYKTKWCPNCIKG